MEDSKSKGKAETKYDIGGPNHVRLECAGPICAAVALSLRHAALRRCGMVGGSTAIAAMRNTFIRLCNPSHSAILLVLVQVQQVR